MPVDLIGTNQVVDFVSSWRRTIRPGDTICLDESQECLRLAGVLGGIGRLTVVTTGMRTARSLLQHPDITVVMPAGRLDRRSQSVLCLEGVMALPKGLETGFFGAAAYSAASGLMEHSPGLAHTKQLLIGACSRRLAAVERSGAGSFGPYTFAAPDAVEQLNIYEP